MGLLGDRTWTGIRHEWISATGLFSIRYLGSTGRYLSCGHVVAKESEAITGRHGWKLCEQRSMNVRKLDTPTAPVIDLSFQMLLITRRARPTWKSRMGPLGWTVPCCVP